VWMAKVSLHHRNRIRSGADKSGASVCCCADRSECIPSISGWRPLGAGSLRALRVSHVRWQEMALGVWERAGPPSMDVQSCNQLGSGKLETLIWMDALWTGRRAF
jgi:hypothetical protein